MDPKQLECPICREKYNDSDRVPKFQKCSHVCCASCMAIPFQSSGCFTCPEGCGENYDDPASLPVNRTLMDLLDAVAIRCAVHETPALAFCPVHYVAVCSQCIHIGCELLDPKETFSHINYLVTAQVIVQAGELERAGVALPQTLLTTVRNVHNNKLRENVDALQKLSFYVESMQQLSCMKCASRGQLTLNPNTLEVYCSECPTPGGDKTGCYNVSDPANARSALEECLRGVLFYANFCDITLDTWQALASRGNATPKDVHKLICSVRNSLLPKKEVQDLPAYCYCPQCLRLLDMTSDTIRLIPCNKALHAICENCACMLVGQGAVMCPLDGFTFQIAVESLPWFNYQLYYQQNAAPMRAEFRQPGEENKAPPEPKKDKHKEFPGTDLPSYALRAGQYMLNRFPSVLPAIDQLESQYTPNNRGWNVAIDKNQVEAMTFTSYESVKLTGVGISNPVKAGITATLTFIKIYAGTTGKGSPVFTQTPNLALPGGNNVLTHYNFTAPFTVAALNKYTIKLKIAPPQGLREPMMVYRGNPFERPEVWVGSDEVVWEFEDMKEMEAGEEANGQNNFTGPILRFFYSH